MSSMNIMADAFCLTYAQTHMHTHQRAAAPACHSKWDCRLSQFWEMHKLMTSGKEALILPRGGTRQI